MRDAIERARTLREGQDANDADLERLVGMALAASSSSSGPTCTSRPDDSFPKYGE